MFIDSVKVRGDLTIELFDQSGQKYFSKTERNLLVLTGREYIAARMKETGRPNQVSHMELGQGTTAPAANNVTIEIPFSPQARVTLSTAGGTVSSNTITYSAVFPAGTATGAVTEAALFNDSVAGTMVCRSTFGVVTKPSTDQMAITWQLTILG